MDLRAKDRIWFTASTLAVYLLLGLVASSVIPPYFKDFAFYAVEVSLVAPLLYFFAGTLQRARPYVMSILMCGMGYLLGAISYLIKWTFLDYRAGSIDHIAHIKSSVLTADPWLTAVFTYFWLLLPLAVLGGKWIAKRLKHTVAIHKS